MIDICFFVQSVLLFHDYLVVIKKKNSNFRYWNRYVQDYMNLSISPKWERETCNYQGKVHSCWMLDRTGWPAHDDYCYAGYGSEIIRTNSDTDPQAMFDSQGVVKLRKRPFTKSGHGYISCEEV